MVDIAGQLGTRGLWGPRGDARPMSSGGTLQAGSQAPTTAGTSALICCCCCGVGVTVPVAPQQQQMRAEVPAGRGGVSAAVGVPTAGAPVKPSTQQQMLGMNAVRARKAQLSREMGPFDFNRTSLLGGRVSEGREARRRLAYPPRVI